MEIHVQHEKMIMQEHFHFYCNHFWSMIETFGLCSRRSEWMNTEKGLLCPRRQKVPILFVDHYTSSILHFTLIIQSCSPIFIAYVQQIFILGQKINLPNPGFSQFFFNIRTLPKAPGVWICKNIRRKLKFRLAMNLKWF